MNGTLHDLVFVIWHSLALYLLLILALRFLGRPLLAQFTLLEYFVIALLGSSVETGLYLGSASLASGLTAATVLFAADRGLTVLIGRSQRLRGLFVGVPLVLIRDGQVIRQHLRQAGLTPADLRAGIRERGYAELDDVWYAVLEVNGGIGVIPRKAKQGGLPDPARANLSEER